MSLPTPAPSPPLMPSSSKQLAMPAPTTAPLDSSSTPTSNPAPSHSSTAYKSSIHSAPPSANRPAARLGSSERAADPDGLLLFERLHIAEQPTQGPQMLAGGNIGSYGNFPPLLRPGTEGGTREEQLGAAVGIGEAGGAPGQGIRHGKCKFFNASKGFGFLLDSRSEELNGDEVFVHYSAIEAVQGGSHAFRALLEGEEVEYTVVRGPKGWQAQHVTGPHGAPCIGTPSGSSKSFASPSHRTPSHSAFGSPFSQHAPLWSPGSSEAPTDSGFHSPISSYSPLSDSPYQQTTSLPPYPYYSPPNLHDPNSYAPFSPPFSPPFAPYDPRFSPPPFSPTFSTTQLPYSPPSSYPPTCYQPPYPPPAAYALDPNPQIPHSLPPTAYYPSYIPPYPMPGPSGAVYFVQEGYGGHGFGPPPLMMGREEGAESSGERREGAGERREEASAGGETASQ